MPQERGYFMKKITLDEKKIIGKISEGLESNIYLYKDESDIVVFKEIKIEMETKNHKTILTPEDTFKNKEKKIQILHDNPALKDEIKILKLVYNNDGLFIGYTMELDYCKTLCRFYTSKKSKKIELLEKLKEKIIRLNEEGIYIGDYNPNNFGVKNNEIVLYDLDNFYVQGNTFDITGDIIDSYFKKRDDIDDIDTYAFNLFTIAFYLKRTNPTICNYLKEKGLPSLFKTKDNKELLQDVLNIDNLKKRYFLDYRKH